MDIYCGHYISSEAIRALFLETIQAASIYTISDQEEFLEKICSASQIRQEEAAKENM